MKNLQQLLCAHDDKIASWEKIEQRNGTHFYKVWLKNGEHFECQTTRAMQSILKDPALLVASCNEARRADEQRAGWVEEERKKRAWLRARIAELEGQGKTRSEAWAQACREQDAVRTATVI